MPPRKTDAICLLSETEDFWQTPKDCRVVTRKDTGVVLTEHPTADGKILVCALNTHDRPVTCALSVRGTVGRVWNGKYADGKLSIRQNDGCIFEVSMER